MALKLKEKEKALISFKSPESIISEQYRTIRTNIQFSSNDEYHTLVITSPGYGDGKSTTVANLAVSMVQQGMKILVIDADLRRPTLHNMFSIDNQLGLANVLRREITFDEAINRSEIEGLDILTSGPIPTNPAELLSSSHLDHLIEETKEIYNVVIFDSSPILDVTDGRVLANKCDGTILVLDNGKTKAEEAIEAKRLLELARANCVGVILNNK